MENNSKPVNFKWVKARFACSIQQMFEELKQAIKEDVTEIGGSLENNLPAPKFQIVDRPKFIKVFEVDVYSDAPPSVTFSLSGNLIRVADGTTNEALFNVAIGLNDDGDCKFIVDGEERDSWQVRRRALEPLFFRAN